MEEITSKLANFLAMKEVSNHNKSVTHRANAFYNKLIEVLTEFCKDTFERTKSTEQKGDIIT